MTDYELWLLDPFGKQQALVPMDVISKLSYTLTANAVGALTLTVPRDALPDGSITRDTAFEIWRRPDGGQWAREGNCPWLTATATRGLDKGTRYWRIKAEPAITLLKRRHVMWNSGALGGTSTDEADDMMKDIMEKNFGPHSGNVASGSPIRQQFMASTEQWSDWVTSGLLAIDASTASAPSTTKQYSARQVLPIFQDIARESAGKGTPLYFDVIYGSGTALAFRTWTQVRGIDRSVGIGRLVVSAERGSLGGTVEMTDDWSDVASAVVSGGSGQSGGRTYGYAYDRARERLSRFGYAEYFLEDTQAPNQTVLINDADSELRRRRTARTLTGSLLSVPGAVYGLDWGFGDRVVAEFEDDSFLARVDSVTVTLDKGQETVTASLNGETA